MSQRKEQDENERILAKCDELIEINEELKQENDLLFTKQ